MNLARGCNDATGRGAKILKPDPIGLCFSMPLAFTLKSMTIHQNQTVLTRGTPLDKARLAMIMVHGRGASAEDILSLSAGLPQDGVAYLAPQAADHIWYPNRFLAPVASNEPYLSSALDTLDALVKRIVAQGLATEKILLLGFSQGASLMLEYVA